jgi:hypothetical protein
MERSKARRQECLRHIKKFTCEAGMKKSTATKEQIIEALKLCARKLKRVPTVREVRRMSGIHGFEIRKAFGTVGAAVKAAGLEPRGLGYVASTERLLLDWAGLARKLEKLPTMRDLEEARGYSISPYLTRFRLWTRVGFCFRRFAEEKGIAAQWKDVLEMIRKADRTSVLDAQSAPGGPGREGAKARSETEIDRAKAKDETWTKKQRIRADRPVYGAPLRLPGIAHEPVNEAGVLFLFGMVAHQLGFQVERIQTEYPDGEAMQEVAPGKWQRVRIEMEYASKNFLSHGHKIDGCDVIVCWRHNWPECPENLEVVELRTAVLQLIQEQHAADYAARRQPV